MTDLRTPAAAAILLLAIGCGGAPPQMHGRCPSGTDSQFVVAFWDRSTSASVNESATAAFADSLRVLVGETLECPGNQVSVFLVHGRTRGKAGRVRAKNELQPPAAIGSHNKMVMDSLKYELGVDELRRNAWHDIESLIESAPETSAISRWTDLLGTFEVASAELASAPPHAIKRIYYFSDMYESMAGAHRRDFDRQPPRNAAEARDWARIDAQLVRREMALDPARFGDVQVRVLTEGLANRPSADQVKIYWLTMFSEMGFPSERVRYN